MREIGSALLVGSLPLRDTEEALRVVARSLGGQVRRLPDGETGPRSDWIVWQYPVLNARSEFEVCPPGDHPYRSLPRLRVRSGESISGLLFGELGYAAAARASYRVFARLKREGVIARSCRFQVCLPTPLAPISAFISDRDQAMVEPIYEQQLVEELGEILEALPHDQLAIQWDANFEFAMLDQTLPSWFADVRSGIVERLLRLGSMVPDDVELGYHFCHGHEPRLQPHGREFQNRVDLANILGAGLGRPLNWLHLPLPAYRLDAADYEPLALLSLRPETELYLGVISPDDGEPGARARITLAQRYVTHFGVATACGWGRLRQDLISPLLDLHASLAAPVASAPAHPPFEWPTGFDRTNGDAWADTPVDEFGLAYEQVADHAWYRNLDPTVSELAALVHDGDILVDYSGGTGILLDRLKLRALGARVGVVIVDSSPKFLRVALEKFRDDPAVAFRHLRFLRPEGRLERLDESLGTPLAARGADLIVSTNAVHLYTDLADTLSGWARTLRPGGKVLINSGNIRNPRAGKNEWILDETVWVLSDLVEGIVRTDESFAGYRPALDNLDRMKRYAAFRDRVFLEPRPLGFYLETLESAGLPVDATRETTIEVPVSEWFEFLSAYHDAVLGWVGGTERIDGQPAQPEAVNDRLRLLRQAIDLLFGHRATFQACWTYLTCTKPSPP